MASDAARPRLAIVADDLTGAADAAAPFATAGVTAAVALRIGVDPGTTVVAVSTESRDESEADATAAVRRAGVWLAADVAPRWWYKKIDSMLRGHPVAEAAALAEAAGCARTVLAPALPARGRIVRRGVVFDGAAELGRVPGIGEGGLAVLSLGDIRGGGLLASALRALPAGVAIADGETEDDLRAMAAATTTDGTVLPAGSAGLATHLAAELPLPADGRLSRPAVTPVLAVIASRHPAAEAQVRAVAAECAVVRAPTDGSLAEPQVGGALAEEVVAALRCGRSAVLTTVGGEDSDLPGRELAATLALVAARPDVVPLARALYLSGGDAADACLAAMGAQAVVLGGEVEPGVPWGAVVGGQADGLPLVTKAGSFGDAGTLARCLAFLSGAATD